MRLLCPDCKLEWDTENKEAEAWDNYCCLVSSVPVAESRNQDKR